MKQKQSAITGLVDKDQLYYESNFNPVSYNGPRTVDNHNVILAETADHSEDFQ